MTPFAGYSMPLAYGSVGQGKQHVFGITRRVDLFCRPVASHSHVRNSVGLFDVGHMVQTKSVLDELGL
jgi:aminomethyltransferase